jgi:hypothetical protein
MINISDTVLAAVIYAFMNKKKDKTIANFS